MEMICDAKARSLAHAMHRSVSGATRDSARGFLLRLPCFGGELLGVVTAEDWADLCSPVVEEEEDDDDDVDDFRRVKGNLRVGRR